MSDRQDNETIHSSGGRTWFAAIGVAAVFVLWGLFVFYTVGVKWPPTWDFGAVADVPGLSVYSTHPPQAGKNGSSTSLHEGEQLRPQHVKGPGPQSGKREESN